MRCYKCGQRITTDDWEFEASKGYCHSVCPVGASKARPARFASSNGSPSDAPSVQQPSCGMVASEVSKPSHGKAEGETFDLSRLIRLPVSGSARVTVQLSEKDWSDVINFIGGDLGNMPEGDEVKVQMNRVCDVIRQRIGKCRCPQRSGGERRKANDQAKPRPTKGTI
jgi:hypothetical protein